MAEADQHVDSRPVEAAEGQHPNRLGQLPATAICGNDITSSCLYVSAFAIIAAGKWAPLALLAVVGVLFLFRKIYAEVVGALPLNGGAYNALLNTTSKARASVAACLTILSYMATAVISAYEAMHYVSKYLLPHAWARHMMRYNDWAGLEPNTDLLAMLLTVAVLAVFAGLTILGVTESSRVAVGIFITHMTVLALLAIACVIFVISHGTGTLTDNMGKDPPRIAAATAAPEAAPADAEAGEAESADHAPAEPRRGLWWALFFGFSASMLGISGFESSANYVEEQQPGVFPKTLRNMWVAVSVINPLMALLALSIVSMDQFSPAGGEAKAALLGLMGKRAGGQWLATVISIDAALVLGGAVLTAYVGMNGLVRRMTLDRCLPQFLLKTNKRGTTHRIIIAFFILAVSVLWISKGEVLALAGVYTISFLSVMALFGIGNVLLKVRRGTLPRPTKAPWIAVIVGIAAVILGIYGNAIMHPAYFRMFLSYFLPAMAVIAIMLWRIDILKALLYIVRRASAALERRSTGITRWIRGKIQQIVSQQVVFFTRGDNVANLNNAVQYVLKNEHSSRIKVVTVVRDPAEVPPRLETDLEFLNQAYPDLTIDFVVIEGKFGPDLIEQLSEQWNIPTNLMFIGSPRGRLHYSQADLGGVRLII